MSKSPKAGRKTRPPAPARAPGLPRWVPVALAVAVVAVGAFWWRAGHDAGSPAPVESSAATAPTNATPAPVGRAEPADEGLKGRWVRTDGGYVVEIRSVDSSGKVDAAYFNPRPIHVEKAEATHDEGALRLFIELRDVNYPGSTYSLRYDAGRDVLEGTYFQAIQRETFAVSFVRQ